MTKAIRKRCNDLCRAVCLPKRTTCVAGGELLTVIGGELGSAFADVQPCRAVQGCLVLNLKQKSVRRSCFHCGGMKCGVTLC